MFGLLKNLFSGNTKEALLKKLRNDAFFVDVRSAAEFNEGSCRGAVNIHWTKSDISCTYSRTKRTSLFSAAVA